MYIGKEEKTQQIRNRMDAKREQAEMKVAAMQSIRARILLLAAVTALVMGVLMIITFATMSKREFKDMVFSYMHDLAEAYGEMIETEVGELAEEGTEPDTVFWEQLVGGVSIQDMDGSYAYIVDGNGTMCYHPMAEKIGQPVENAVVSGLVERIRSGNIPTEAEAVEYEFKGAQKYAAYYVTSDGSYIFVVTADENEALKDADAIVKICTLLGVIAAAFCVAAAFLICHIIVKPIKEITEIAMNIANLDFRKKSRQKKLSARRDEIGAMSRAIDTLQNQLSEVVGKITEQSGAIFSASEQMNTKAESINSTVEQVDRAVQEIADGATSQADETQKATENVVVMGNMIEESNTEMEVLRDNARSMRASSEDAAGTLGVLDEVNHKATEAIDVIYTQTNTTNESALKIREATTLITSIAEETNLLSLNATIEAARAGEQGRGFAVVAGQIQKLAEQSNESARQIDEIINQLISDSQKAVETMDEVKQVMQVQNENVIKTRDKFTEVQSGIGKTIEGIRRIAEKIEKLDEARVNVVDVVQNLTAIAQENAAGTEETSASVTEVGNHMFGIAQNSGELKQIADNLEREMQAFQI